MASMQDQVQQLEARISNIELNKQFETNQDEIQSFQMEMLTTLRSIRQALVSSSSSSTGENGSGVVSNKEIQALKEENERLSKINAKQSYRIEHLVRSVEELQKKVVV